MQSHTRLLIVVCIIGCIVAIIGCIKSSSDLKLDTVPMVEAITQPIDMTPATTTDTGSSTPITPIDISSQVDISNPLPNSEIKSPLVVTGRLRGSWFFEATAGVAVLDSKKQVITVNPLMATTDWMTSDWVSFTGTTSYPMAYKGQSGYIQISNDNPSGLPENSKTYLIPVLFR